MRRDGEKMKSLQVLEKIQRSISPKFEHVVIAIEESKDLNAMTTDKLMGTLEIHEQRINKKTPSSSLEQALQSKLFFRDDRNEQGGISQRSRGKGRGYNNRSSSFQGRGPAIGGRSQPHFALRGRAKDLGANNHMCGKRESFVELDETVQAQVSFGDSSKTPVKGRGNILIKLKNGDHDYISSVYYVPAMKNNILSMGQLLEKGYDISMKDCHLTIKDNHGNLIARVRMSKNQMFALNIQHDVAKCLSAIIKDKD
ncbi:uncharacterized protein LOC114258451 [Camellia sinensis]|uniref:uncharacterized protein LOC114258451 n=1 Tax=Camellia sinensis TaxID=4442 RepID=UPI001036EA91|nr:uncharacterized protein LOC114258451 [Camellia sinensis]